MGEGKKRNKMCECGSGKKAKKCCGDKKPRSLNVTMEMQEPIAITSYEITSEGGLKLFSDGREVKPAKANLNISINRINKKTKHTVSIYQDVSSLQTDVYKLINNADFIYAVDTNTSIISVDDYFQSVGVCLEYRNNKNFELELQDSYVLYFKHQEQFIGEKTAIVELIRKLIIEKNLENNDFKILLVTDHDLGNLDRYNSQQIPLIEGTDLFLPSNFTLVYASAYKKNDSILNNMISECDREASRLQDQVILTEGSNNAEYYETSY